MKICYFGIYTQSFGRNKVYISGLKENGVEVIECCDNSPGILKYWRLWRKHRLIRDKYDCMIVGYPGHLVVPLAKLISHKKVVFDALCTLYEGEIISRGKYRFNLLMRSWVLLIDWLAVKCADLILVETNTQKDFFVKRFLLKPKKVVCIFTGVDEDAFYYDPFVQKQSKFKVLFRGQLLREAGVKYIVEAAKILENQDIDFLLIGNGHLEKEVQTIIDRLKPKNLERISTYITQETLRIKMQECHVSLGQFEKHERLARTIPHKAFESFALRLPYITGDTLAVREIMEDGTNAFLVPLADSRALAEKILFLSKKKELLEYVASNAKLNFETNLSSKKLASKIIEAINKMI